MPPLPPCQADVLDQWQRAALGDKLQLRMPLRSKADLLRLSVILREFSTRLEVLSTARGISPEVGR